MELISVIVPFGNNEATLQRCMDSILDQTLTHLELVMVSDGSTDGCCDLVRRAMLMDNRVRLVQREHAGVSAARNAGLQAAEGGYIQFVDADDYVEPTMVEKMYQALQKTGTDIAVCNFEHPFLAQYIGNRVLDFSKKADRLCYYQHTFAVHLPWNKLFRRSVLKEGFLEGIHYCEDGMFNLANMNNACGAVTLDEKLYHYYVAPPQEKPSCIGAIAKAPDYWLTKETYWYKRARMQPLCLDILQRNFAPEDIEDFQYVRIFDFMLWELLIFEAAGAEEPGLIRDLQNVLSEELFQKSLRSKAKYGLCFLPMTEKQRLSAAADFVHAYLQLMRFPQMKIGSCRPVYLALDLFLSLFAAPVTRLDTLDATDLAAEEMLNLLQDATPEARLVNRYLQQREQLDG